VPERYVLFKGEDMPDELDQDVGPVIVVTATNLTTRKSAVG